MKFVITKYFDPLLSIFHFTKVYFLILIFLLAGCVRIKPKEFVDPSQPVGLFIQSSLCRLFSICPKTKILRTSKELISFTILEPKTNSQIVGNEITLTVPASTNVTRLKAGFIHTGDKLTVNAIEQISNETANDFTNKLTYTVHAEDGTTTDYYVTVNKAAPYSKDVTSFEIVNPPAKGNIHGNRIDVYVPFGTDITKLVANFSTNASEVYANGSLQVSGISENNYAKGLAYTVVAEDRSFKNYIVVINIGGTSTKELLYFGLETWGIDGVIENEKVIVNVPYNVEPARLNPSFSHNGVKVTVSGTEQKSGDSILDFGAPVIYTIYAADGTSKDYTVLVQRSGSSAKEILSYTIPSMGSTITIQESKSTIEVIAPYNADLSNHIANFSTTGAEVRIDNVVQKSGVSSNDYHNPITYTVIAVDGSSRSYLVITTLAPPPTYTIQGTISGLTGTSGVSLKMTGSYSEELTIATNSTTFQFNQKLLLGSNYIISVSSQPINPHQICNLSGDADSNYIYKDSVISVVCSINQFSIGGSVTGLSGSGFTLNMTGSNSQTINIPANSSSFSFSAELIGGSNYSVSIGSQPTSPWQSCVLNGDINLSSINQNSIVGIVCTTNQYTLSGGINCSSCSGGKLNSGLVINNGNNLIPVNSNSTSYTSSPINSGSSYTVTIESQPEGQTCAYVGSTTQTGSIGGNNINGLDINCVDGVMVGGSRVQKLPPAPLNIPTYQGNVTTFVSSGLNYPVGITFDGNYFYVADLNNHKIKQFNTSGALITSIGGGTDFVNGTKTTARFNEPRGIATDGTYLYVSENLGRRIKKIKIGTWQVSTIAGDVSMLTPASGNVDGIGTNARFSNAISGLTINKQYLFVADRNNHSVRKIDLINNMVSTMKTIPSVGDVQIVKDYLYAVNINNHTVHRVFLNDATYPVEIVAGVSGVSGYSDGTGTQAKFSLPHGISSDETNLLLVDFGGNIVRRLNFSEFRTFTIAGYNGGGTNSKGAFASFTSPTSITTNNQSIYLTESNGYRIRKITDFGLVAYYPLTSFSNAVTQPTTLYSYVEANTNNLTNNGATMNTGVHSENNTSLYFDGLSKLNGSDSGLPNGTSPQSICVWMNPTSLSTGNKTIIHYGATNSIAISGTKTLTYTTGNPTSTDFNFALNTWYHICGTSNGTVSKLYINGNLMKKGTVSATSLNGALAIGSNTSGSEFFNGKIADVRIYSRELNDSDINMLSENGGATGLVAGYNFDNGSTNDYGPTGLNLTPTGSPINVIGKDGDTNGAKKFDGSTQYYSTGSSVGFPLGSNARTMCAWVSPSSYKASETIIGYGTGSTGGMSGLKMFDAPGTPSIGFMGYGSANVVYNTRIPLNTWTHICANYDGIVVNTYLNGKKVITQNIILNTGSSNFSIAAGEFHGKIDDVRVYNNALSDEQVRRLALQVPEGLVARYDFNGDGNDVSGFGQNATSNNATLTSDKLGLTDNAYSFDGSTQGITVASTNLKGGIPLGTTDRTLCGWIKANSLPVANDSVSSLWNYGGTSTGSNVLFHLYKTSSGTQTMAGSSNLSSQNVTYRLPINLWNYICQTYSAIPSNPTVKIYVNGGNLVFTGSTTGWNTAIGNLNFAHNNSTARLNGSLDDIRIYNRVLSLQEIQALSGYHPLQTTNAQNTMKLHLQADTLSTMTTSVSSWLDSSFIMNDVTGANNPLYVANSISSKPAIQFSNATNNYLTKTNPIGIPTNAFSFFSVGKRNTVNTNSFSLFSSGTGSGGMDIYFNPSNQLSLDKTVGTTIGTSTGTFGAGTPFLVDSIYDGTTVNFYSSGTVLGTSNNSQTFSAGNLYIGINPSIANGFDGDISELLYYNYSLTDADRKIVDCYLSAKYGIAIGSVCP